MLRVGMYVIGIHVLSSLIFLDESLQLVQSSVSYEVSVSILNPVCYCNLVLGICRR